MKSPSGSESRNRIIIRKNPAKIALTVFAFLALMLPATPQSASAQTQIDLGLSSASSGFLVSLLIVKAMEGNSRRANRA
jgi:hypothetical protein